MKACAQLMYKKKKKEKFFTQNCYTQETPSNRELKNNNKKRHKVVSLSDKSTTQVHNANVIADCSLSVLCVSLHLSLLPSISNTPL